MSMKIDIIEKGELTKENNPIDEHEDSSKVKSAPRVMKWGLLILSCIFSFSGMTGGPMLLRLYFLHGGNGKWLSSWLQMAGFPILIIPLIILYCQRDPSLPNINFFASHKLLFYAAIIGIAQGVDNFLYCYGLSFLPVSTSSLLVTTQLIFTSFVSFIWVKQKFTHTINAIVNGNRPPGVTNSQYLLGFFITIAAAALVAFILIGTQVAYAKANQAMTYPIVLQFQLCLAFFATITCTIGSLINRDFSAIQREASEFDLGAKTYYLVLVSNMIVWQLMFIGRVGIIFCASSLFASVTSATFLPITQTAAVITFRENFPAEKGMALALILWGFTSYIYGSYMKEQRTKSVTQLASR
ncbi:hypothetical protein MKX01_042529 [Papaver californicum]|nr:hypothetical protein MKX01_042529 [Papaver californicum]